MDSYNMCQSLLARRRLLVFVLAFVVLSGCAATDFFYQRYENSVAYFNTYYNASRVYDEALLEIETTEKSQRSKGLPPQKEISQNARQKLTTVIEKCSKLLQYHPNSKWVDDALMLIGKSYYYQGEYPKAERKFAELIAQFPNSKRFLEARLWLGKSFKRNNEFDQAIRELNGVAEASVAEGEKAIAAEAFLTLGEIHAERKSQDDALKAYQDLINRSDSDEGKAEAQFRIAELYEVANDYAKAATAFRRVLDFKPDYSLAYSGWFRHAVNLKKIRRYDEALRVLSSLLDDRSNADFYPQIRLEIANVLNDMGELERAIDTYEVIDTTYARTDVAAKGFYQLGLIYEKKLHHYAVADTNYLRARTEFPSSEVTPLANRRVENLRRYFTSRKGIVTYDSLLVTEHEKLQGGNDTVKTQPPDSLIADSLSVKTVHPWTLHPELWDSTAVSPAIRDLKVQLTKQTYELALLFFLDLEEPDSALVWCSRAVRLSPDSELASRALYTLAEIHRSRTPDNQSVVDSLHRRIISNYPNTRHGIEVKRLLGLQVKTEVSDPAEVVYRQAEKLLQDKRAAEAIALLHKLVKDHPTSPWSPKALYAIGWIYENVKGHPDSAAANYRTLTRLFPRSSYASTVIPKLTEADLNKAEQRARSDSTEGSQGQLPKDNANEGQTKITAPVDSSSQHGILGGDRAKRRKELIDEEMLGSGKSKVDTTKSKKE